MTKQDADAFADMVQRNTGFDPRTGRWQTEDQFTNYIAVRIGGYYTIVPLSDSTDEAIAQIEGPDWNETGRRFSRLQRDADRT